MPWADALTNAFVALKNQQPTPQLGPLLTVLAGMAVGETELIAFVQQADENEPALTRARIALAKWDSQEAYLGQDGAPTPAHSQERRAAIYARAEDGHRLIDYRRFHDTIEAKQPARSEAASRKVPAR